MNSTPSRYDPIAWEAYGWAHGDESPSTGPSSGTVAARNLQTRKYRATQIRGPSTRDVQITVSRDKLDVQASKLPKIFRGGSKSLTIPMSYVLDCVICSSNAAASGDLSIMPFNKVPFVISYLKPPSNDKSGNDNMPQSSSVEGCKQGDGEDKLVCNFTLEDVVRLEFEAQWSSARAIFNQIKVILSCCPSQLRDDYVNLRLAPATISQS
ncbi:unnamed protein product [Rodentolepis nana]|uniref:MHD domain-containing protein n=1 Tax=Rodentolepis nana TaxID=102285 RepID=A0A158QIU3_RODNA|nr:unnamed protein product [Rodentolepis nana]